ncbi:MAG: exopolyphosphatase / guanosine-5-triphosphate,3-diphosphate pyrophosphatase, partial [Thermoleophilaceae bacterium]|nr:exopolyphosphatase / guanosine-5-triphosphate,3-diphosphate pyrophosphatase [Thermoleophilaceae bacterium]
REGVFFERLLGERELFEDVRAESVRNLAHRFEHHGEHDEHVWALSRSMFDGLAAAGLHGYGAEERELLWAACLLHDIGVAVNYDDHHRHSHYLTLNAGLPGFTPRELILIGLIARYHRKGTPDASELGDLAEVMERGGFESIEVTEAGLREGIFFERLLGEDPLFDDVRAESVRNLAHRFGHHGAHDLHVWALSRSIYDGLAEVGLHGYGRPERELLWAACLLHDIGVAVNYDDHHRHSHYLTLNAGLPGFTPRELILIGLIARYHRKGAPDASELGDLKDPGDDERLQLLCGVIRLAEQLERSRDRAITDVSVAANGASVSLRTESDPSLDATVPIWAARRNADLLSDALGRDVEIES